jgi:hypothetical protein
MRAYHGKAIAGAPVTLLARVLFNRKACIAVHSRVLPPLQEMEHGYMQQLPVIKFPIRFKTEDVLRVLSRGNESKPHDR